MNDCGSHTDMDHPLMLRSIEALRPWFARIAAEALKPEPAAHECVAALGIQAEKAMFEATGGVNTHRGALFSLGLTLVAAACLVREGKITPDTLQKSIKTLAAPFKGMQGSHGSEMKRRYGLKGAADMAAEGYQLLFSDWLPFWRRVSRHPNGRHLLLLRVMAKLEDTNLYHRGGQEGAEFARTRALALLQNFSPEGLQQLNTEFIGRNLSPGGSADMFALTLLISSLIS